MSRVPTKPAPAAAKKGTTAAVPDAAPAPDAPPSPAAPAPGTPSENKPIRSVGPTFIPAR